ncbi:hypothetical protein CDG77_30530 [Nostoc sp. 'Peltigera membranacea cyanobiont' 213]|nr:hypothetical protein CDG77_30530 [Nostoc sp. 'Peltigera membranacea cyanobiont' 213]
MKSYSVDLREKIVAAHLQKNISIRKVANIFSVSKSLVQKLVKQQRLEGNLQSKPRGKPQFSHLTNADIELRELVELYPDATLIELCELFADKTGNWVGQSAMSRALQKLGLNRECSHSLILCPTLVAAFPYSTTRNLKHYLPKCKQQLKKVLMW